MTTTMTTAPAIEWDEERDTAKNEKKVEKEMVATEERVRKLLKLAIQQCAIILSECVSMCARALVFLVS